MPEELAQLDAMLAIWNEADAGRIRARIDAVLSPDVVFIDPAHSLTGRDAFEKMVHQVHAEIPGAVYSRASAVDSHHGLHRYHWEIHQTGKLVIEGFDVTEVGSDGLISRVEGFFGPLSRDF